MEGVEVIKNQIKSIERKIKKEAEEMTYCQGRFDEAFKRHKLLKKQKEDLDEMIKPYLVVEELDDN